MKEIYFAGGCFWGTEHFFKQIKGVTFTEVGYANGRQDWREALGLKADEVADHDAGPGYKQVCTDLTGFAETVRVQYDPDVISLDFLLQMYFAAIDPTSLNRQGHDEGTQYRTGVYYVDAEDVPAIRKALDAVHLYASRIRGDQAGECREQETGAVCCGQRDRKCCDSLCFLQGEIPETRVQFLGWEDSLEEGMATHSSILAWRIPVDRGACWATIHGVAESLA